MNIKLFLSCAMVLACYMDNANAEDCSALKEQAKKATGQQKVELWQQAIQSCPSSDLMYLHYQHGLALITTKSFAEALDAFKLAGNIVSEDKSKDYYATKVAILGRQAQVHLNLQQRAEALTFLNVAINLAKAETLTLPKWLVELQKYNDDNNSQQPFTAEEVKSMLKRGRDVGIEPKIDYQITFDFNTATMTSEGEALLSKVVESFQNMPSSVVVVGHTDTKGDTTYNQTLSEKRAVAIKKALAAKIPALANKLTTQGKGKTQPKYNGGTPDDDQRNRRVEFVFVQN